MPCHSAAAAGSDRCRYASMLPFSTMSSASRNMNQVVSVQPNCSSALSLRARIRSATFHKWPMVIWTVPIRKHRPMIFWADRAGSVRNGIWILSRPALARISGLMPKIVPVTRPQTIVQRLVTVSSRTASLGSFLRASQVRPRKIAP